MALLVMLLMSAAIVPGARGSCGVTSCGLETQLEDCGALACLCPAGGNCTATVGRICGKCSVTSDCNHADILDALYNDCLEVEGEKVCTTKKIFSPFLWQDGVSSVLVLIGGAIASGAGIGGGGLYVPLFVMFGWGKKAVARSLGATTGLALAMMIMIAPRRHPEVDRPLIDYRTILLLEPIVLLGTVIGKILNKLFPTLLVYILLQILLLVISVRTWQKYRVFLARDREKAAKNGSKKSKKKHEFTTRQSVWLDVQGAEDMGSHAAPGLTAIDLTDEEPRFEYNIEMTAMGSGKDMDSKRTRGESTSSTVSRASRTTDPTLQKIYLSEARQPWRTIGFACLCWVLVLVLSLIVKQSINKQGNCGTGVYWGVTFLYVPVCIAFTIGMGYVLAKDYTVKESIGYEYAFGDIRWTTRNLVMYPAMFMVSGLLASLLGIGGGMVIGPLLLEIGFHPVVSSATTAAMTLFTASSATIQYLVDDSNEFDYFLWYVCITVVAGLLGRKVIQGFLDRTGKQSVVVFLLAIVITTAFLLMGYTSIVRIAYVVENNVPFEFQDLCPASC